MVNKRRLEVKYGVLCGRALVLSLTYEVKGSAKQRRFERLCTVLAIHDSLLKYNHSSTPWGGRPACR